jgi:hypothetical protein
MNYKKSFQKNQGRSLPLPLFPSKKFKSFVKSQTVDRLAAAKFQGQTGLGFTVASTIKNNWGGFAGS